MRPSTWLRCGSSGASIVIENNRYAMGTVVSRSAAKAEELYDRGAAFGIPGEQVDGMDVRAVKAAGDKAVAHGRAGKGPHSSK